MAFNRPCARNAFRTKICFHYSLHMLFAFFPRKIFSRPKLGRLYDAWRIGSKQRFVNRISSILVHFDVLSKISQDTRSVKRAYSCFNSNKCATVNQKPKIFWDYFLCHEIDIRQYPKMLSSPPIQEKIAFTETEKANIKSSARSFGFDKANQSVEECFISPTCNPNTSCRRRNALLVSPDQISISRSSPRQTHCRLISPVSEDLGGNNFLHNKTLLLM
jgi:hypothetical protein